MEDRVKKLQQIAHLAGEKSSDRRRELLRDITDLFLEQPSTYTSRETWFFGDIMESIAYDLEVRVRLDLAQRLADETAAPPDLIRKLASDEITVARPVIERSSVLSQDDLIEIAGEQSQEHLLAITKRPDIGERVSEVLVDNGNDEVVQNLVDNETASISETSYERVAERAISAQSEGLSASLAKRPDLPNDILKDVLSEMTAEIRERIIAESCGIDRERLDDILSDIVTSQGHEIDSKPAIESQPELVIRELEQRGELNAAKLIEFAQERRMPEFICGLAKLARIDMATARRVSMDRTGDGLALTCRAGDMPTEQFSKLMQAFGNMIQKSQPEIDELVKMYDSLAVTTAQRIIRFWNVRKSTLNATVKDAAA